MHNSDYTTEYEVEKEFIDIIKRNWYRYSPISSYEELVENFRNKLNLLNKDILADEPLTNEEFNTIMTILERKSVFDASQLIRRANKGKIDYIKRNGHPLYLKLIDLDNCEKNMFEVAHQIKTVGKYNGRFDVTLLVNGLPLVQIELKKPGVEIQEAFNQIQRYKNEGNYNGLFNFIQIFVISNQENTRYFCNNDLQIYKSNCFTWTDEKNKPINKLYAFEESFLFCPFIFRLVIDYMIDSASQKKLFVMRPYQIYAFEALKNRCLKEEKNGYCFHSTGSGKTLTSFKFAYEMSLNQNIDKVFFLVDRKDLDDKTVDDFSSYMSTTSESFTNIKRTDELIKKITKSNDKLIISTINKMANALKGRYTDELKGWKNKKMIFMFDECHRSQAGEMRKVIDKYFTNALYYGFTGTPIFDEKDEISENTKLTALYFGKPVHTYTLKEAIGDRNVLPLCIDYIKTVKVKNETYLLDKTVQAINYEEALLDERRCNVVVNNLLDHYESKTNGRQFNSIFACQSIELLLKYYKILLNNKLGLKIAAIYSFDPNEDCKEGDNPTTAKNELSKIIDEFNKRPEINSNFNISTYAAYEREVINLFRNKSIDILLVVDKCLTGMDFVKCNSIYLDKSMKMHGLIQAISRTIRTNTESKNCGNVICYQTSRKAMDEALTHFNNDEDVYNDVTLKPLEELIILLNEKFEICKSKRNLAESRSEKEQLEFVNSFRELMRIYKQIVNYVDFDINNTKMDMTTYYELQSLYKDIYNAVKPTPYKESILNDIDFEIELLGTVKVDFDYIVDLLLKYHQGDIVSKKKTKSKLIKNINEIPEKPKKDLILKFVYSFMDDDQEGLYKDPKSEYEKFINKEKKDEINKISQKYRVETEKLIKLIEDFAFYQDDTQLGKDITKLYQKSDLDFDTRFDLIDQLSITIKTFFDTFNGITIY